MSLDILGMCLMSFLRNCKSSHAVCMCILPAQQMWTPFVTGCSMLYVAKQSQVNSHRVRIASSCMQCVLTIRLQYGDGLWRSNPLCWIPRRVARPQMMGRWRLSRWVAYQHSMQCCSCSPASAHWQSAHISPMAWSAQICANYNPIPINPVRKNPMSSKWTQMIMTVTEF